MCVLPRSSCPLCQSSRIPLYAFPYAIEHPKRRAGCARAVVALVLRRVDIVFVQYFFLGLNVAFAGVYSRPLRDVVPSVSSVVV